MKKNVISVVLVAVIALVVFNAGAREVRNVSVTDFTACKAYLTANPTDTIVGGEVKVDGYRLARRIVFLGEDGRVKGQPDTIRDNAALEAEAAAVNRKFMESAALDKAYANPWRDYKYYHADWVEEYASSIGVHKNSGVGIEEARNRQGLSFRVGVSAVLMDGKLSPEFSLGGSYSWHEVLKFYLTANVGQQEYGSSLYRDQRYWSVGYSGGIAAKLFQWDNVLKNLHNRVYVRGEVRQVYTKIGQEFVVLPEAGVNARINSWGNDLAGGLGLVYEHDSFGGLNWELSLSYVQNFGGQLNARARHYGAVMFGVAFEVEMLRNIVRLR